ncbi:MAG: type I glyceraldehyde-3-phosphate dehydrogenase [Gammaproteobacteria bacterium]|jgi:glyceraldehyde 3-phosphate dehydrogenase
MTIKIAINGFGRIGRNIVRAIYENNRQNEIKVVAVNDLIDVNAAAYLLKHDTVHGTFPGEVKVENDHLVVDGDKINYSSVRNLNELPWGKFEVDVVHECTGIFRDGEKAKGHLEAGAKKVLISAPGTNVDATVVHGVNDNVLKASDKIVSNASCTTNCLAPLVKPLMDTIGLVKGLMVTTHAFTNDQVLIDGPHKDLRRARAATQSMIPTKTGAAAAVGLVLPEMKGKLDGFAIRVPVINVSLVDLTFEAGRETSVDEVNKILLEASKSSLKGILSYNDELLVSHDYNHCPFSSNYDATMTKVIGGNLVKVMSWYDNEWGFSNRMLDATVAMMKAK